MTTAEPTSLLVATTRDEVLEIRDQALRDFEISRIPWSGVQRWYATDHAISHDTGGFFDIAGIESLVTGTQYLMIHQVQSALTSLVRHRRGDDTFFLVQARQEPGNLNGVQLAPTIQSTPANYLAFHGGKPSDYIGSVFRYDPGMRLVSESYQVDLGRRYQGKTKRAMILDAEEMLETAPGFAWVAGSLLAELSAESGLLNPDLRTLLTVSPWGDDPGAGLVPASDSVRRSLQARPRSEVIAALTADLGTTEPFRPVPMRELRNWERTEDGLYEREPDQGFSVEYFSIAAPGREVVAWTQPLVNSNGMGRSLLLYRVRDGLLEIGVHVVREHGLVAGAAVAPSVLDYPGSAHVDEVIETPEAGEVVGTLESDEGGRFFKDISNYVTRPVDDSDNVSALTWITIAELKALLRHSAAVTMQLRSHASQLLSVRA